MALSDTAIKGLTPTRGLKGAKKTAPYEVADDGGLFIEVQPSGAKGLALSVLALMANARR